MSVEGGNHEGNIQEFAVFCLKFHELYYDHTEAALDEYESLGEDVNKWNTAALKLLKQFEENTGITVFLFGFFVL